MGGIFVVAIGWVVIAVLRTGEIMSKGVESTAVVVAAHSTARVSGAAPVVQFTLDVRDPNSRVVHRVTVDDAVSPIDAPRVQPGMTVPVKFMPKNPRRLLFLFD